MIKKLFTLLVLLEALRASGVAPVKPLPTNFVQNISLQLSVVAPGKTAANGLSASVTKLMLRTKDAIKAIGLASGNNFSPSARLVGVSGIFYFTNSIVTTNKGRVVTNKTVFGYTGVSNPVFQIRDGAKVVDVSSYFTINTVSNTITSFAKTKQGRYTAYKSYRIRSITVSNPALSFSGQGFVVTATLFLTVKPGIIVYGYDDFWTSFTGEASNGVANGILQGVIAATFDQLE